MNGDFRPLLHPGTMSDEIDVDGTRTYRQRQHDLIRAQQLLERLAADESARKLSGPSGWARVNSSVEAVHQIDLELLLVAARLLRLANERPTCGP